MRVGDLARATGLTVRTLHHWDELGLVVPSGRTPAGHRQYGDDDVRRLYQVAALRRLGLALGEIKELLDGVGCDPRDTVRRQLAASDARVAAEAALRERLTHLRAVLDRGAEPTTDDLLRAVEATTMVEQYYTEEQLAQLAQRREQLGPEGMERAQRDWQEVLAGFEAARVAGTDPGAPEVRALAERARGLVASFTGGDPGVAASVNRLYAEQGAERASQGAMSAETGEYMRRAMEAAG